MKSKKNGEDSQSKLIKDFILSNLTLHPSSIVSLAMKQFDLSRPTVLIHLNALIDQRKISKSGTRNKVVYKRLDHTIALDWLEAIGPEGDENRLWEQRFEPLVKRLDLNVRDILRYAVSEMINNAIDHSEGSEIYLSFEETKENISINIADNGVGIFNKISLALGLADQREAMLHLSKGKFTTDSKNHSGQGIFFSSRAVDEFVLQSGNLFYTRLSKEDDWLFESRKVAEVGTIIRLTVGKRSKSNLAQIFKDYSDEEDPGFNKTQVIVKMALLTDEEYVSRSQARRILLGLEKFQEVILDFRKVRSVGQGFVDEVYRVFSSKYPEINMSYRNANEDIEFMIRRGLEQNS